jgi:hypothetical protein
MGLRNTRARLETMYGGGGRWQLELRRVPGGGTAAILVLPFRAATEEPESALHSDVVSAASV